ncbi:hypothetical protein N7468_005782 [Penicillium chermesinum]|uniref:Orc1-like AAA ATPase domain-containing protein n=1 Tax=Penicillium chermesinum TaxID=63820 RepID=A0A9W9P076_9EURO|nr:uncharacterized protein N7468_005782 [Penicillium chermesinum]KAJ5232826.1 hypothetical protein N7468_005782 [Penicillium chermesinum]KAJ6172481.1 hypothetical protein N7470_001548 [Penicillium chermesinum]
MSSLQFDKRNRGTQVGINYGTINVSTVDRFHIPLDLTAVPLIENFVGRQEELHDLWEYLRPVDGSSRKVAILHGLGGMGKTQLAVRFARTHKADFSAIFWLSGNDKGALLQSLSSALSQVLGEFPALQSVDDGHTKQRANQMLHWLASEGNSRWLVIFDNVDQYSSVEDAMTGAYDIGSFLPPADHGSILITSRIQDLTHLGRSFPISRLNTGDAVTLLLQNHYLPAEDVSGDLESYPDIMALVKCLDGLPLAIAVAAAFMRQTGTTISEYLQLYQNSWSDLQAQSSPGRQYPQGDMSQTWMISYEEVKKRNYSAAVLLLLFAHFDNRNIPSELVRAGRDHPTCACLREIMSDTLLFKSTVKLLLRFSLLEYKQQEGSYAMHPVVQKWCLHVADTDSDMDSACLISIALVSVEAMVPKISDKSYTESRQSLIPHVDCIRAFDLSVVHAPLLCQKVPILALFYIGIGRSKEAEQLCQMSLPEDGSLRRENFAALLTLSNLYAYEGKLKEATVTLQQLLANQRDVLMSEPVGVPLLQISLGNILWRQAMFDEAGKMFSQAQVSYKKAYGQDHEPTLLATDDLWRILFLLTFDARDRLGLVYLEQGRLEDAESISATSLTSCENTFGRNHMYTFNATVMLGRIYCHQGRWNEAQDKLEGALAGYVEVLRHDHLTHPGPERLWNVFTTFIAQRAC